MKRAALSTRSIATKREQVDIHSGRKPAYDIILDSGAFSAWRLGQPIDLDEYCDFLLENQDWIAHSVALDVINPNDPEAAARESYENYIKMRKRGLHPVPVFHVGERMEWLHKLIDAGATYIGLSASSIAAKAYVDDWYALAWGELVDGNGLPTIKAHAFGEGRIEALLRFPWYSADSTSWLYTSQRSGIIQIGHKKRVGFRNDGYHTRSAPDVAQLSAADREILQTILAKSGVSMEVLNKRNEKAAFIVRAYLAAVFYIEMEQQVRKTQPIYFQPVGFIEPKDRGYKAIPPFEFNLHLVAGGNYTAFAALAAAPHRRILASYYYLKFGGHHKHLRDFVLNPKMALQTKAFKSHYDLLIENLTGKEDLIHAS